MATVRSKTLEDRLNTQTDAQLRKIIEMCEKIIRERQSGAKRDSFRTSYDAISFLIDVAVGNEEHDDDMVFGALKMLSKDASGKAPSKLVAGVEELVGSMSNTAWMLQYDEFDNEDEHYRAEEAQEKDYAKLQTLFTRMGFKFDSHGRPIK